MYMVATLRGVIAPHPPPNETLYTDRFYVIKIEGRAKQYRSVRHCYYTCIP